MPSKSLEMYQHICYYTILPLLQLWCLITVFNLAQVSFIFIFFFWVGGSLLRKHAFTVWLAIKFGHNGPIRTQFGDALSIALVFFSVCTDCVVPSQLKDITKLCWLQFMLTFLKIPLLLGCFQTLKGTVHGEVKIKNIILNLIYNRIDSPECSESCWNPHNECTHRKKREKKQKK